MNFVPGAVDRSNQLLAVGRHDVMIKTVKIVNDRMKNLDGELKTQEELDAKRIDWKDSRDQLAIVYFAPKKGMITARLNTCGFDRFAELENTDGHFQSAYEEPYAVNVETGERVLSEKRTGNAKNIINEMFDSMEVQNAEGEWIKLVQIEEDPVSGDKTTLANMKDEKGNPRQPNITDLVGARCNINVVGKTYGDKTVSSEVKGWKRHGFSPTSKVTNLVEAVAESSEEEPSF